MIFTVIPNFSEAVSKSAAHRNFKAAHRRIRQGFSRPQDKGHSRTGIGDGTTILMKTIRGGQDIGLGKSSSGISYYKHNKKRKLP